MNGSIMVASLIQWNMDASMGKAQQIRTSEVFHLLRSPYFSRPYAEDSALHAQVKKTRHDRWAFRVAIYGYRVVLLIMVLQGTYLFLMNTLGRIIHESI